MPQRPPRKWFGDCVAGVEAKGGRRAKNPAAICGSLWHHKMSAKAKKEALAREKRRSGRKTGRKTGRKKGHARATRGLQRGYYAINGRGRVVAGPFTDAWQAKDDANRAGGWVQYEPG